MSDYVELEAVEELEPYRQTWLPLRTIPTL